MGFVIVGYSFKLSREDAVSLIFDNQKVSTVTTEGENLLIHGAGFHRTETEMLTSNITHRITTHVDFLDHDRRVLSAVTLTKATDGWYSGFITPVDEKATSDLDEKVLQFLANFPNSKFNSVSRQNYHENTAEWVANKALAIRAALLSHDDEGLSVIREDVAHILGWKSTEWWVLEIMREIVAKTNHAD